MPFVPTIQTPTMPTRRPGSMEGSEKLYLDRRDREISEAINKMSLAIKELQDFVASLP